MKYNFFFFSFFLFFYFLLASEGFFELKGGKGKGGGAIQCLHGAEIILSSRDGIGFSPKGGLAVKDFVVLLRVEKTHRAATSNGNDDEEKGGPELDLVSFDL